jgi:uncharacterized metal-binding protein (TIGR02443 family)
MTEKITKRFIAGAVCPRCGDMDRLVTYATDEGSFKECVSCGFSEKQIAQVEMSELETRVNHFPDEGEDSQAQVVQIMDLKPKN